MDKTDYFATKREALKRTHEKDNKALASYQKQFEEESQRLENFYNPTVIYNIDDDGEESIQVKDPKLREHILNRLETLSSDLQTKFQGLCLEWVEKEVKIAGKCTEFESAERFWGLYEDLVKRLQKLDWEILGVEEEDWKMEQAKTREEKASEETGANEEVVEGDEKRGEGDGDVGGSGSGSGSGNVSGMNGGDSKRVEAEYDEQVEMSTWGSGVEESGRGRNVWTGNELLEESSGTYVDVTAQNTSNDYPEIDPKNCATQ